ncbi:MAG: S-layer homology domain-containing protein, partial [Clostridia bacterium]|nr:S-layer homology domain-containing protein [Clostridia bacterium]
MKRILSTLLILAMLMPMSAFAANDHLQFTIPAEYFYGNVIPDYVFKVNAPRIDKGEPIHLYLAGEVDVYYCTGPVEIQFNDETPAAIEQIGGGVSYAKDFSFAPSLMPEEHIPADDGARHYTLVKEGVYYASCRVMNAGASAFFVIEDCQEYKPELKSFSDVATGRWSHGAIMEMVKLGMFNGTKDPDMYGIGEFSPEGTMSKAQFITVMTRYLYADELSAMGSGKTWFSNAYDLAVKKGLISESEFDYAKLEKPMTREEMALIAVRTAEKQGEKAGTLVDTSMLKDYSSIGSYYKDYALKAFSMGLITGYGDVGTFAPDKTLTREQGAMVAYRLVNKDARADV